MQVATILPTPLLGTGVIPDESYSMSLYHVVKDSPTYAQYFKELRAAGMFVIMDNGAAEGVNPTAGELMKVYAITEPSEIILPDIVYDQHETLRRTSEAYKVFVENGLHEKYQFMAVPQGNCYSEWLSCMKVMLRQEHITTIGVSKFVTPQYQNEMGPQVNVRLECVDAILQEASILDRQVQIHLLGCWSNPKEVGEIDKAFGRMVRGTDSAIAYVYTRAGIAYNPEIERPDNHEVDFINGTLADTYDVQVPPVNDFREYTGIELLKENIAAWIQYCQAE